MRVRRYLKPHTVPLFGTKPYTDIVLVSREDRSSRRCSTHRELASALGAYGQVTEFVGDRVSLHEARNIFQSAWLVVAPHGGALLNMIFMHAGAGVVEIGYYEPNASAYKAMRFPPWYFVMAKHAGINYNLVMAPGSYVSGIQCPVDLVLNATEMLRNL